jgi:two-component system, oxyanion-binding sensor
MSDHANVTLGFMPLLDSALLIAAQEKGFARQEGLKLNLVRETSWANIRDRVAVGHFQGAHMLAPMPIASNLGRTPLSFPVIAPMALGLGGNAITVSNALYAAMEATGIKPDLDPATSGHALKQVVNARLNAHEPPLRFAVVHPFSGHNYELRYWLSACGIDPVNDIEIVIVPPPLMADAMEMGTVDGYCVGEPWNSVAVARQIGRIITVRAKIWRSSPEKVLGLAAEWANRNPDATDALLRALYRAAQWCAQPENHVELATVLSRKEALDVDKNDILPSLTGHLRIGGGVVADIPDFFLPLAKAATFPWQSHALWFYSQMVRWGHCTHSERNAEIARDSYRPDIYRRALFPLSIPVPDTNLKVEGALQTGADGFFDGKIFDPDHLEAYISEQMPRR